MVKGRSSREAVRFLWGGTSTGLGDGGSAQRTVGPLARREMQEEVTSLAYEYLTGLSQEEEKEEEEEEDQEQNKEGCEGEEERDGEEKVEDLGWGIGCDGGECHLQRVCQ